MLHGVAFMVRTAWQLQEKKTLFILLSAVILANGINLLTLFFTPTILSQLENGETIGRLLLTIAWFSLSLVILQGLAAYAGSNKLYSRVQIRSGIIAMLSAKANRTSYPNTLNESFHTLFAKAFNACNTNMDSTEAVWKTLETLLTGIVSFVIYLLLLTNVQPLLFILIIVTSSTSFFITNHFQEYRYQHREDEAKLFKHLMYLGPQLQKSGIVKELSIFGMKPFGGFLFHYFFK